LRQTSVVRRTARNDTATGSWLRAILARKPARLVTVAVANKTARIAWTLMARGGSWQTRHQAHPSA